MKHNYNLQTVKLTVKDTKYEESLLTVVSACPESFASLFRVFDRQRSEQKETERRVFTPRFVAFLLSNQISASSDWLSSPIRLVDKEQ